MEPTSESVAENKEYMMNWTCFFLEPTNLELVRLRRYSRDGGECSIASNHGYHQEWVSIGEMEAGPDLVNCDIEDHGSIRGIDHLDPRWPQQCKCGFKFGPEVKYQFFPESLYKRSDNGQLTTWRDASSGAMLNVSWREREAGPDGIYLAVKVKDSSWEIDSRASNCDSPCKFCSQPYHSHNRDNCSNPGDGTHEWTKGSYEDSRPEHRCWIRHGTPPLVTVDKNGITCGAGGGSIIVPGWHGFLRNGVLEEC